MEGLNEVCTNYFTSFPALNTAWCETVAAILRSWDSKLDRKRKDRKSLDLWQHFWVAVTVTETHNSRSLRCGKIIPTCLKHCELGFLLLVAESIPNWHNVKAMSNICLDNIVDRIPVSICLGIRIKCLVGPRRNISNKIYSSKLETC